MRTIRYGRGLAILTTLAAITTLCAIATAAGPASAATSGACPNTKALDQFKTATNVAASYSNSGSTTGYTFYSLQNENPVAGVPGLVKYCVYPGELPTVIDSRAFGANGQQWTSRKDPRSFSFVRPAGNKSNIPLDGTSTDMGTATWAGSAPVDQIILLHLNDATVCRNLYGSNSPGTCFVKPSAAPPQCEKGDTSVAYNAIPFGGEGCAPPSWGFEAQITNEFGHQVQLATGTGRQLVSLNVMFSSYACSVSGSWFDPTHPCVTTPGETFEWPITATIYAACGELPCPGAPLAQVTVMQTIPYRPSADPTTCPDGATYFNPTSGLCQYSIQKLLTFGFPTGITLPETVIWTVAFNTTHSGYQPAGTSTTCFGTAAGCPYDSLNVAVKTYPGAPYAGSDPFPGEWILSTRPCYPDQNNPCQASPLQVLSGQEDLKPLGEIITS